MALWQQSGWTDMTADSRQVKPGSLFVAYPGERQDGRKFIQQAIAQGAGAVVYEQAGFDWASLGKDFADVPHQAVMNLREQVSQIAAEFYAHPSQQLWMLGVTGTNGKTTVSHWLASCFAALNKNTALIGTLGHGLCADGALTATINTTPDAICLQAWMADYVARGAEVVSMEVSSHGLAQGRVNEVKFDVALFTNLSRDHLDFHGDMQSYGAAKARLFDCPSLRCSVINMDDDFGRALIQKLRQQGKPVLSYGIANQGDWVADIRALDVQMSAQGVYVRVMTPNGEGEIRAEVLGQFNVYNLLAVLGALLISGVDLPSATNVMGRLQSVAGRMQRFGASGQPLVVVDYAHTPDALRQVLLSLRQQTTGKLICVFGCGGNRDQGKRGEMGAVANELADEVVVTSDNPRDEDANVIIQQIAIEVDAEKCHCIPQRDIAIASAIQMAQVGDSVLVAGKGHEDYQEIAGVRQPFSDAAHVQQALMRWAA
jgi:UDP-N-acetylmuramyl-tripeptide synthetase